MGLPTLLYWTMTQSAPKLSAVQEAQERLFDWLDHEIIRVSGTNAAPVVSKVLEKAALAGVDEVIAGLHALTDRHAA